MEQINWDRFKELAAKLIEYKVRTSRVHINADSWEEVIYAVLVYMEHDVVWNPASHAKGVDLEVRIGQSILDQEVVRISAKGGKAQNQRFSMSSYRLTRYDLLEDKLEFLKDNADDLDIYLNCVREERYRDVRYYILKIPPSALVPDALLNAENWEENNQGWYIRVDVGFDARIVKSMSHQLWYDIPLNYPHLDRLGTIDVPRSEIGSELPEILQSLDK
ncbi:hypothetical protein ES703_104564 [subsurface metagenome]